MEKNGPFFPGIGEGAFQFRNVVHHAETALGIGMVEGIGNGDNGLTDLRSPAGGQFQESLSSLTGQVVCQLQQGVFIDFAYIAQPLDRHTVAQQIIIGDVGKQVWLGPRRLFNLHVFGNTDFLDRIPDFHPLCGAGLRVCFQLAPLGPFIGFIVVVDVAEQQTGVRFVYDQADVAADPHRPEVRIFRLVEFVQLHPRIGRVQLQVEGGGLDNFLFVTGKPGEAVGKGVGNPEFHLSAPPPRARQSGWQLRCTDPRRPQARE